MFVHYSLVQLFCPSLCILWCFGLYEESFIDLQIQIVYRNLVLFSLLLFLNLKYVVTFLVHLLDWVLL